ncbi:MAG: dihydroorotase [Flavobacteriaceae bacterium]
MNILLKSAKIINAPNKELHLKKRDILIKNGRIDKIAQNIEVSGNTKRIDHKNLHISIGWFDSSVSFGEPGYEERETIVNGLHTAAKSGFTDIVLNPNTFPVPDSSSDIVFVKNASMDQATNLHPLGSLTAKGDGVALSELYDMNNAGAVGFYDFKRPIKNSNLLKIALQYAQNFNGLVYSFPLDYNIAGKGIVNEGPVSTSLGLKGIPSLAEELQIARDLFILEYTGGKLHIPTISTENSVRLVAQAKKKGLDISCSVAIHNLVFTDTTLDEFDSMFKVMPPLRAKTDCKALIKGLKDGIIDFVCTDHIPMNIEIKSIEFDNAAYGSIGMESAFGALNPIFGIEMSIELLTKGRTRYNLDTPLLKEKEKACLTIFDPEIDYVFDQSDIVSSSKNSIFLGYSLKGKSLGSFNNEQLTVNGINTNS